MAKINKSIEIVTSTIKRLSSMSLALRVEVKKILEQKYSNVQITDVCTLEDLQALIARKPDLVFLGMKFVDDTGVEPEWLTRHLSEAGIAYTGSAEAASMLEHDKQLAKLRIRGRGIATAVSLVIKHGDSYAKKDITIKYPVFIKPVDGGGGSGINDNSLVHNFSQLKLQVSWLMDYMKSDVLLESYLPGREFSVGILKMATGGFYTLPLEIVAPVNQAGLRFLSSRIKREDTERTLEIIDFHVKDAVSLIALKAFKALGAQDYGRIDIRMDASGKPNFLEANLLPSLLNNYGNLPKAALMNMGLTHEQLILRITELGFLKNTKNALPVRPTDLGDGMKKDSRMAAHNKAVV